MENLVSLSFWKNKKVLITGHTGFKGSWLSLWLQTLNAQVIGYSLTPPTHPNLFTLANIEEGMTSIIGDIRDFELLEKTLHHYQPEIIIHMAAQPLVRYSYQHPVETYHTNVLGTVHVLEAARKTDSVRTIINVTTDKCYENNEWIWGYRENDRLGGHDPYSSSKACAELVTTTYQKSFFQDGKIGLASTRAGNVIGGGDWAQDRLIPDIMRACINNHPIIIRNPHSLRPWQHVLEPLGAYLLLAQRLYEAPTQYNSGWNVGPNENDIKPVSWIVDYISQHWDQPIQWQIDNSKQLHEANLLKLDCAKAKTQLHWQPRWHLGQALQHTIDWYQAYQRLENIRAFTLSQIHYFMQQETTFA